MRIAIVHSFYTAATPSGENITVEMQAQALKEAGHEVTVVEAHTDHMSHKPLYKFRTAINVATGRGASPENLLRGFRPDVVHVHNLFPNYSTNWLDRWQGPLVTTLHNFRPLCSNGLMFRDGHQCSLCPEKGSHHAVIHACYRDSRIATLPIAIKNRHALTNDPVIRRANKILVLSERSFNTYSMYGAPTDKITILPNFINAPEVSIARDQPGDSWLYAGRLNPEKGIVDLLRRWPHGEPITVAGAGEDKKDVISLQQTNPGIKYIGSIPRKEVLDRLRTARGVIIPSLCAENLPTIYLEALAFGLPIIAHTGNSAADDIEKWAPGMTYASSGELRKAIAQGTQKEQMIANKARKHFEMHYTKASWLRRVEETYENLLSQTFIDAPPKNV